LSSRLHLLAAIFIPSFLPPSHLQFFHRSARRVRSGVQAQPKGNGTRVCTELFLLGWRSYTQHLISKSGSIQFLWRAASPSMRSFRKGETYVNHHSV
jgi:hypothetical protein